MEYNSLFFLQVDSRGGNHIRIGTEQSGRNEYDNTDG
jgi:hypothetical protein